MKTLEIIGYKRANLGKQNAKRLRSEANAPAVLYGGNEQINFYTPMALLKDLLYTPEVHFLNLHIDNTIYRCILKDAQFHPVSEMIMHVDFMVINDKKPITMQIPLEFKGSAPGVMEGGNLVKKIRKLAVKAYPKDMPSSVPVDISHLKLGQTVRVRDTQPCNYEVLMSPSASLASVEIPRALRSAGDAAEKQEESS